MKGIGYVTTFIIVAIFNTIFSGYALSVLWGWFVVPAFNLPQISIATAIGLALIVSYLTHQEQKSESEGKSFSEIMFEGFLKAAFKPAFSLAVGWIVSLWV